MKKTMNEDIKNFPIFILKNGKPVLYHYVKNTHHYNHSTHHLHHYIRDFEKNKQWYEERGIKQKLFLISIVMHEQIHFQAVNNLSDEEFQKMYKISRWELFFSKKHSKY